MIHRIMVQSGKDVGVNKATENMGVSSKKNARKRKRVVVS